MAQYDVAFIGAGPGGYIGAIRAAQWGAKTVVIERDELGGVCLNYGCIPTKTLLHTAELYQNLRRAARFGIDVDGFRLNMRTLLARKNHVVRRLRSGVCALFEAHGIEVIKGEAWVEAPGVVKLADREITVRSIVVATGSSPASIPGLETDGTTIITSTEALELSTVPGRVAIIGAGALGAEFACIWNAFDAKVALIEQEPSVLPNEDEELTTRFGKLLMKRGVDVRTRTSVAKADTSEKGVRLSLEGAKSGDIEVDLVLVAIGVKHNSEAVTKNPFLGVAVNEKGAIIVDQHMETTVPGIYAVGDVVGKTWLAHGASAEGIVAAANATGGVKTMDYRVVPACTFTLPELAHVGLTEKAAHQAGIDVRIGRFDFAGNARALATGQIHGMVKIVGDKATDEVVGVHILGPQAGELISSAAIAMEMEATVEKIGQTIHTHPTLSESMMEAAEDYFGMGIHTIPDRQ